MPSSRTTCIILATTLLIVASCGERQSRRLGEIYTYKAVPSVGVIGTDRSAIPYELRGPGYPAAENANRIFDIFSGLGHVGPNLLIHEATRLEQEAQRAFLLLDTQGDGNSPDAKALAEIANEARRIQAELHDATSETRDGSLTIEAVIIDRVRALMQTSAFLRNLSNELKGIDLDLYDTNGRWIPWSQQRPNLTTKYPLFIRIAGLPLDTGTVDLRDLEPFEREILGLDSGGPAQVVVVNEQEDDAGRTAFERFCADAFRIAPDNPAATPGPATDTEVRSGNQPARLAIGGDDERRGDHYRSLFQALSKITERSITLKRGLDLQWDYLPIMGDRAEVAAAATNDGGEVVREKARYRRLINEIKLQIIAAQIRVDRLTAGYAGQMRALANGFGDWRVQVEVLAKRFDRLVPRHPNRLLTPARDAKDPPTRLTVILKRLFVRYLDTGRNGDGQPPESRGASLLVTCEVQSGKDLAGSGTVRPLILENHFSPGHFVNVRDRIVYGPRIYTGEFLNVKLSVVRLSALTGSPLEAGLNMAIDSISDSNPALAAASPFVSTLFRGLLNSIDEDAVELSYQFMLPGPEGDGKADIDMLRAETGHYIILKRENRFRGEYDQHSATLRYTNHNLIYNPEDSSLYYRRDMENPRNNFVPENLFREQTYLVFAITDEYVQEDDLGEALRNQLASQLGDEVSRDLIPDIGRTRELLDRFAALNQPLIIDPNAGATVGDRQDQLWQARSDIERTVIIESLYNNATPETQHRLGRGIDSWKRATLRVNGAGLIEVAD